MLDQEKMPNQDREACFSELFRDHYHQLFGYVYTLVRNYADAEDVVQQTSLILWNKFEDYQLGTSFIAWACGVARLESMNFLKRQRRYRMHFSEAFQQKIAATLAGIPSDVTNDRISFLEKCIKKLPENQQELLRQCFGGTDTVADVARKISRTTHSLYSSLRNIRKKLLDCVDQLESEIAEK